MKRILLTGKNADIIPFLPRASLRGHLAPSSDMEGAPYTAAPSSVVSATSPSRAGAAAAPCVSSGAQGAPSYDATHDVWIVPPSRMTRDAGSAADLRPVEARSYPSYLKPSPVARPLEAAGRLELAMDIVTTALGLTVFGVIAGVFLVLA